MILSKIKNTVFAVVGLSLIAGTTSAYAEPLMLSTGDNVAISFWLISMAMVAATAFFILERDTVSVKWRTSLTVAVGLFWRLLVASLVMLVFGYLGEAGMMAVMPAFIIAMAGWLYILYEIFAGEASKANAGSGSVAGQKAFKALALIVTVGWAIYPIGYAVGYLGGGVDAASLNLVYNLADFVNKIAFGMAIYVAAKSDN